MKSVHEQTAAALLRVLLGSLGFLLLPAALRKSGNPFYRSYECEPHKDEARLGLCGNGTNFQKSFVSSVRLHSEGSTLLRGLTSRKFYSI